MSKDEIIESKGECPECGSNNIKYGTLEWREDQFYYPFECEECGTTGKEWYVSKYAETTIDE